LEMMRSNFESSSMISFSRLPQFELRHS